jgi:hypothetical protein
MGSLVSTCVSAREDQEHGLECVIEFNKLGPESSLRLRADRSFWAEAWALAAEFAVLFRQRKSTL